MTLCIAFIYPSQVYHPSFLRDVRSWFMDTCPTTFTILTLGDSNKCVKNISNSWPLRSVKLSLIIFFFLFLQLLIWDHIQNLVITSKDTPPQLWLCVFHSLGATSFSAHFSKNPDSNITVALPGPPDPSLLPSATPTLGIPHSSFGKEPACKAGDLGLIPGSEDPLEKGMATHSIILPGEFQGLYSPWGHRVGHDWAPFTLTPTITSHYTFFTSIVMITPRHLPSITSSLSTPLSNSTGKTTSLMEGNSPPILSLDLHSWMWLGNHTFTLNSLISKSWPDTFKWVLMTARQSYYPSLIHSFIHLIPT